MYYSRRLNFVQLLMLGLIIAGLANLLMLGLGLVNLLNFSVLFLPMTLYMFGAGFLYPNSAVGAVGYFHQTLGTASSALSVIQANFVALMSFLLFRYFNYSILPLASLLVGVSVLSVVIYYRLYNRLKSISDDILLNTITRTSHDENIT